MADFPNHCEILFIRHGETDWNRTKRLQGNLDIPLNDVGRSQVREASRKLHTQIYETPGTFPLPQEQNSESNILGLAAIISSPLSRAAESAQILADCVRFPKNQIVYNKSLAEWNAGEMQGLYLSEVEEKCPESWKAWRVNRDPHFQFNGGESFLQRRDRVVNEVQSIAECYLSKRIMIVCHSGVIDEIFRRAKNVPLQNSTKIPKQNAGLYIVTVEERLERRSQEQKQQQSEATCLLSQSSGDRENPRRISKSTSASKFVNPKWKILRWGLHKVPDRRTSIDFDSHNSKAFDPYTTEYA